MRVFGDIVVCQDANDGLCAYIRVGRIVNTGLIAMVIALDINTSFDKLQIIYKGLATAI